MTLCSVVIVDGVRILRNCLYHNTQWARDVHCISPVPVEHSPEVQATRDLVGLKPDLQQVARRLFLPCRSGFSPMLPGTGSAFIEQVSSERYPMPFHPSKYWRDILAPILRRDQAPVIPQAIVLRGDHVLLVQRDNPLLWELPGGSMAAGETPEQTVIREVREETGLDVAIIELLGIYERTGFRAHRSPVYVCHPTAGNPGAADDDTVQIRFFPLQTLPRGMFPWYRPILQHDLGSSQVRPLHRTQHLGLWTLLQCTCLDLASRCGCST